MCRTLNKKLLPETLAKEVSVPCQTIMHRIASLALSAQLRPFECLSVMLYSSIQPPHTVLKMCDELIDVVLCVCCYSGLSEEARADFRLMKDVAVYTRIVPQARMESLDSFMKDLQK